MLVNQSASPTETEVRVVLRFPAGELLGGVLGVGKEIQPLCPECVAIR